MIDFVAVGGRVLDWVLGLLRARRRLRVRTRPGALPTVLPGDLLVIIEAINTGRRRVVVNSCGFDVNSHEHAAIPAGSAPRLPVTLEDGDNVQAWYPVVALANGLMGYGYRGTVKLRAWVRDTTDTKHRGDTIKVDLEYAAKVGKLP